MIIPAVGNTCLEKDTFITTRLIQPQKKKPQKKPNILIKCPLRRRDFFLHHILHWYSVGICMLLLLHSQNELNLSFEKNPSIQWKKIHLYGKLYFNVWPQLMVCAKVLPERRTNTSNVPTLLQWMSSCHVAIIQSMRRPCLSLLKGIIVSYMCVYVCVTENSMVRKSCHRRALSFISWLLVEVGCLH